MVAIGSAFRNDCFSATGGTILTIPGSGSFVPSRTLLLLSVLNLAVRPAAFSHRLGRADFASRSGIPETNDRKTQHRKEGGDHFRLPRHRTHHYLSLSCAPCHAMSHPEKSNGRLDPTLRAHADTGPACVVVGIINACVSVSSCAWLPGGPSVQPSIIFFDEIDGLAPVRSVKQDQIHASVVSTLLALMDGLDSRGQVLYLIYV